jgi:glucose/arabinose dehydrogenase
MRPIRSTAFALVTACLPAASRAQGTRPPCAPDNAGIGLPAGFCALVAADGLGPVRHLAVAPNGDVFAAVRRTRGGGGGGAIGLRDADGDGVLETQRRFGTGSANGIALDGGHLYLGLDDGVVRWALPPGQLEPAGTADTVVWGLVNRGQHSAKSIALGADGALYVNIGAPSNNCQQPDRRAGVPGVDPCPLLDSAGGIWRFDAARLRQTYADGERFATGLRNTVALTVDPATGGVFGAMHGRDQLSAFWPQLYNDSMSAEKPAEELFKLERGGDYGWPYCYYDPELRQKVLAPEYGGDGRQVGRCARTGAPLIGFPAHWAPNALQFYTGTQFPPTYRGGLFIAFHGSWNRAPLPQQGYNVTFVPFTGGEVRGAWQVFARFWNGEGQAERRPTGLALAPDGSLYVSDDRAGRIYRIVYVGR